MKIISSLRDRNRIEKANRYYFEKDRLLSLAGSWMIQKYTAPSPLFYSKEGKPYKEGEHFSLSHSSAFAIFAKDEAPLGIDIEQIRPFPISLIDSVLSENEKLKLHEKKDFFKAWCLKESLSKAIGTGLKGDFKSIPAEEGKYIFNGNAYYSCLENRLENYTMAVTSCDATPFEIELVPDAFAQ